MGKSSMADMRIRNVPPGLHKALKIMALERDTTLELLVIKILQTAVDPKKRQGEK